MSPQDLKLVCLGFTKMSTCVNQIFDFNNMRLVGPLMGLTLEKKESFRSLLNVLHRQNNREEKKKEARSTNKKLDYCEI
jgi:hypothetical protein